MKLVVICGVVLLIAIVAANEMDANSKKMELRKMKKSADNPKLKQASMDKYRRMKMMSMKNGETSKKIMKMRSKRIPKIHPQISPMNEKLEEKAIPKKVARETGYLMGGENPVNEQNIYSSYPKSPFSEINPQQGLTRQRRELKPEDFEEEYEPNPQYNYRVGRSIHDGEYMKYHEGNTPRYVRAVFVQPFPYYHKLDDQYEPTHAHIVPRSINYDSYYHYLPDPMEDHVSARVARSLPESSSSPYMTYYSAYPEVNEHLTYPVERSVHYHHPHQRHQRHLIHAIYYPVDEAEDCSSCPRANGESVHPGRESRSSEVDDHLRVHYSFPHAFPRHHYNHIRRIQEPCRSEHNADSTLTQPQGQDNEAPIHKQLHSKEASPKE